MGSVATIGKLRRHLRLRGHGSGRSRPPQPRSGHAPARRILRISGRRAHHPAGCDPGRLWSFPTGAGFHEEYRLQRMQRDLQPVNPSFIADALSGPPVRPMTEGDLDQVAAQDLEAFGADRRTLLESFRSGAPEYAWVTGDDTIDGYLLGRHGHAFDHLGPLVARDERTARRLVARCVSAHPDRPFILDAPSSHAEWSAGSDRSNSPFSAPLYACAGVNSATASGSIGCLHLPEPSSCEAAGFCPIADPAAGRRFPNIRIKDCRRWGCSIVW